MEGVVIEGLQEILSDLKVLPEKLQNKYVMAGMRAVGKAVAKAARIRAPAGTEKRFNNEGKRTSLKKSIGYVVRRYRNGKAIVVVVGPRWPEGAHGHLIERGHLLVSHGLKGARRVIGHVAAHPFLRPALNATKGEVIRIMRDKVETCMRKEIRKK